MARGAGTVNGRAARAKVAVEPKAVVRPGAERVNLDWHALKAVVLQSDDWGLCAWVPDEQAHRVLAGQPAFRSEALAREIESMLLDLSARIIRLARHAEAAQAGSDSLEEADQPGR